MPPHKEYIRAVYCAVVIHISIGSPFSSCHNFACTGAQDAQGEVHVVDSNNFCIGQGILCVQAAKHRDAGMAAADIAETLRTERAKVRAVYYLHALDFLSKSGRCPALVSMGATLLNLHPSITVNSEKGEVVIGKKYRGKNAPEAWLRDSAAKFLADCDPSLCFFMHTPDQQPAQYEPMQALAKELLPGIDRLIMDDVGCTVIAHVGGNSFALVGMMK